VWERARGRITFLQSFENEFLSRNLDQNVLKNSYFWKNNENRRSVDPESPLASGE